MTLRVEGAHTMLKTYFQVSMGDLHIVHEKISLVILKVSTFALKKVHEQFLKASSATSENPLWPCSGTFKSSMGLLCSYIIRELLNNDKCLQLDDFYQHCHQFTFLSIYQKNTTLEKISSLFQELTVIIQDPEVQYTRGRPAGAKNHSQSSTKRDPSTFELIMSRKYGICHEARHNNRTCPNTEIDSLDENSHTRRCSICCETGHNSRTCPNIKSSNEYS
ncbi:22403_t:CDS:2 [Gigaspora margarita]|uniref:22403_t:CDS:1 n=1 Tax=Gigaspora margarita TaxID=4874 RepID=A0ABN7VLA0_GIGMA|nr:22403_t:CDS:2 [Gigaspora margarita]